MNPPDHVASAFVSCECGARSAHDLAHSVGQRAAVRVAEDQGGCASVARGAQRIQRIGGIGLIAVEEVLGVIDQLAAALGNVANALRDHGEVLRACRLNHLIYMERPALPEDRDDRRFGIQQRVQVRVDLWSV